MPGLPTHNSSQKSQLIRSHWISRRTTFLQSQDAASSRTIVSPLLCLGATKSDTCPGCVIQNDDQHILLIDGGFGTFQTKLNGEAVSVADLSEHYPPRY